MYMHIHSIYCISATYIALQNTYTHIYIRIYTRYTHMYSTICTFSSLLSLVSRETFGFMAPISATAVTFLPNTEMNTESNHFMTLHTLHMNTQHGQECEMCGIACTCPQVPRTNGIFTISCPPCTHCQYLACTHCQYSACTHCQYLACTHYQYLAVTTPYWSNSGKSRDV